MTHGMRRRRDRPELAEPLSEAETAILQEFGLIETSGLVTALASLRVVRVEAFKRSRPPASEIRQLIESETRLSQLLREIAEEDRERNPEAVTVKFGGRYKPANGPLVIERVIVSGPDGPTLYPGLRGEVIGRIEAAATNDDGDTAFLDRVADALAWARERHVVNAQPAPVTPLESRSRSATAFKPARKLPKVSDLPPKLNPKAHAALAAKQIRKVSPDV